jgi:hypothetical protein
VLICGFGNFDDKQLNPYEKEYHFISNFYSNFI